MRIAVIGSRGIPNHYGGFEECAAQLSKRWVTSGHEVVVYNSSLHPYTELSWEGVELRRMNDPEDRLGTFGQFIYDLNCIRDCRKSAFDIILQLGYTSSGVWQFLLPRVSKIVTNMDGLEWKRSKYNFLVRRFLRWSEYFAARSAHQMVADNSGILDYLDRTYGKGSVYIPYGAEVPEMATSELLQIYGLESGKYDLLVARMEPENNICMILEGLVASDSQLPVLVVGYKPNAYGLQLQRQFEGTQVRFHSGVFERTHTDALRQGCRSYFHGHSVGGTNPSLLEAMACGCHIHAHDNPFNRNVLGTNAHYFSSSSEIEDQIDHPLAPPEKALWKKNNLERLRREFQWESIAEQYLLLFEQLSIR
jgi:glycosyltransferase involved in cell wall biosynthesis